jgi:MarR family 2-MHQ and catechol resistance regulon transcriptional repressor
MGQKQQRRMGKKSLDTSGIRVWLIFMKAHRTLWRHAVGSIDRRVMKHSDFAVLEALLHKGPQLVSQLGRRTELTSGSITSAVDRLEKRGLVRRVSDVQDRRARMIHLTREGKARVTKAFARHVAAMERAAAGLNPAERAALIKLLKKLGLAADRQLTDEARP